MSDIALVIVDNCYDLALENGDLKQDEGFETAVSISLFTDRRVTEEDLAEGDTEKRGWWGDTIPEVDQDQIGSKLWLLEREKTTEETRVKAEGYCREALAWMIEDGVATTIQVAGAYIVRGKLALDLRIFRPEGETRFSVLWDEQSVIRRV